MAAIFAGLLAGAVACSTSSSVPAPASSGIARSTLARDASPSVSAADLAAAVDGDTEFAIDAYKVLAAASPASNFLFSPHSISVALAMAYAGAGGQTAGEMAAALHYTLPDERLQPAFDALDLQLAQRSESVVLRVANSLWGYEKESFGQGFLDTLARDYGAGVRLEDFADDPDGSRARINAWVADQTDQKIPNLLAAGAVTPRTRLVIANAVYFDGLWQQPFDPRRTADRAFTRPDGTQVNVPTMSASALPAAHARTSAYDAVEIAYDGGEVAMDIVVPKAASLGAFEAGLTSEALGAIVAGLERGPIRLAMPKFTIAGDAVALGPMLQGFGMKRAFVPGEADFAAIARDPGDPLYIGGVTHRAYVSVDESGTEAAAATGVSVIAAVVPSTAIQVDRAFFFLIRDRPTGAVLFAGHVADPSAS
jgi:serpin B